MPAEACFLNLVKGGPAECSLNAGKGAFSSAQTLIFLFEQRRIKVVCVRSVRLMCQGSPKRPHLESLMGIRQLKAHFGSFASWAIVRTETCQCPWILCVCVFFFPPLFFCGSELKHLSIGAQAVSASAGALT